MGNPRKRPSARESSAKVSSSKDLTSSSEPKAKCLVHIQPHKLWIIKILKRFKIIGKEDAELMLEEYLDSISKIKAHVSQDSEKESDEYLISLEPTRWKDQDHYLVLGLQNLRYEATEDDIRRAHKRKALKHHPDKRGKSKVDLESDYYSCITRAMDILGNPGKRRSFDSVDPTFDDTIPNPIKLSKLDQDTSLFYNTFGPIFELNSRWSIKSNVPCLGNDLSPRDHVERFYEFWYNFQSWREFSYLDEEDRDKGENRDERRWLDRQNKGARQQRKKAENQRIRQLVDNAYNSDPRIAKFRDEMKQRKIDLKKARQEESRLRIEREEAERPEKSRLEEEERQKKIAIEEEEKRKRTEERKQRDQQKKEWKRNTKWILELFKENDYFVSDQKAKVKHMDDLDRLFKTLTYEQVQEFKDEIEKNTEFSDRQNAFLTRVKQMHQEFDKARQKSMDLSRNTNASSNNKPEYPAWYADEVRILLKSLSIFPVGLKDRWDVVGKYVAAHSIRKVPRDGAQVANQVKLIKECLIRQGKAISGFD